LFINKEGAPLRGIAAFIFFNNKEGDMTMKNRLRQYCILFLFALLISLSVSQTRAVGQEISAERMDRAAFAELRIERLQQTAKTLRELAVQPLPETLTDDEKTEVMRYTRWLRNSGQKLDDLAKRWKDALSHIGMVKTLALSQRQMAEMNISFNRRYAELGDELVQELRQHTTISYNIKSNYDIAQRSIDNLR
jgi:hypothetical protein